MHAVEGVHSRVLDWGMAAPNEAQHLVEGPGCRGHPAQAQLHHDADGLGDVGGGLGGQEAPQPGLSRVQKLHELDPLSVALLHPEQGLPLLLPGLLARVVRADLLGEVLVHLPRDAHLRLGLALHAAPLLRLLRLLLGLLGLGLGLLLLLALKLGELFCFQLLQPLMDLVQQLLRLRALIARALQGGTIGMELHEGAHQLHGRLPGHARRVLHAADRQIQHSWPLLPSGKPQQPKKHHRSLQARMVTEEFSD